MKICHAHVVHIQYLQNKSSHLTGETALPIAYLKIEFSDASMEIKAGILNRCHMNVDLIHSVMFLRHFSTDQS